MKFCKDCTHCKKHSCSYYMCFHPKSELKDSADLVTGELSFLSCQRMRLIICGPNATLFERKNRWRWGSK